MGSDKEMDGKELSVNKNFGPWELVSLELWHAMPVVIPLPPFSSQLSAARPMVSLSLLMSVRRLPYPTDFPNIVLGLSTNSNDLGILNPLEPLNEEESSRSALDDKPSPIVADSLFDASTKDDGVQPEFEIQLSPSDAHLTRATEAPSPYSPDLLHEEAQFHSHFCPNPPLSSSDPRGSANPVSDSSDAPLVEFPSSTVPGVHEQQPTGDISNSCSNSQHIWRPKHHKKKAASYRNPIPLKTTQEDHSVPLVSTCPMPSQTEGAPQVQHFLDPGLETIDQIPLPTSTLDIVDVPSNAMTDPTLIASSSLDIGRIGSSSSDLDGFIK
ncbi:hypothetical protein Dimus_008508, partial [Dionaea muscipula]